MSVRSGLNQVVSFILFSVVISAAAVIYVGIGFYAFKIPMNFISSTFTGTLYTGLTAFYGLFWMCIFVVPLLTVATKFWEGEI